MNAGARWNGNVSTIRNVIEEHVVPALGDDVDDYDVEAIAHAVSEWQPGVGYVVGQTPGRWSAELAQVETARAALADAEQALRAAVLRAVEAGEHVTAIAEAAGVGRQTVYRWRQDAERV